MMMSLYARPGSGDEPTRTGCLREKMSKPPTIQITPTQGGGRYREVCEYAAFLTTTYPTTVSVAQAVADKIMADERFLAWRRTSKRKAKT